MNYLLDTNVISELITKQPNPRVTEWLDRQDPNHVFLSVITIGEVNKGIERLPASARKDALRNWLTTDLLTRFSGRILTLDIEVMLTWGTLTGQLERIGRSIPAFDSLVAALALQHNCILVTRNERDFTDTGVNLINPWS